MLPSNAPRMSFSDYEMYYGIQVTEFIMQIPRQMGLWTGEYPDNKRTSTLRDRCIVMWRRLLLVGLIVINLCIIYRIFTFGYMQFTWTLSL